jgi:predicted dehydrogenase
MLMGLSRRTRVLTATGRRERKRVRLSHQQAAGGAETGTMTTRSVRVGIAGCGTAARIHLDRLLALDRVEIVGCADPDLAAARALADHAARAGEPADAGGRVAAFGDHRELIRQLAPEALAIFTPHLSHYRLAMDALQAGCHVFVEKPLSTNLQEATDIVGLAQARDLKVGVGHQFRLCPALVEARRRLAGGTIGRVRLVTAILARPWLATLEREESQWRFNPKAAGSGMLADAGDHLIDALLWTTGQQAHEVASVQSRCDPTIDVVTAAAIRLADGTPVTLAVSAISPRTLFELEYFGESGRLRATETTLAEETLETPLREVPLPASDESIDGNFIAALVAGSALCCAAVDALGTVRLSEGIARSVVTGQIVQLI